MFVFEWPQLVTGNPIKEFYRIVDNTVVWAIFIKSQKVLLTVVFVCLTLLPEGRVHSF